MRPRDRGGTARAPRRTGAGCPAREGWPRLFGSWADPGGAAAGLVRAGWAGARWLLPGMSCAASWCTSMYEAQAHPKAWQGNAADGSCARWAGRGKLQKEPEFRLRLLWIIAAP